MNKDPRAAELGRLRSQVQQLLQLQVISAAGGMNVGGCDEGSQASQEAAVENKRLEAEKDKLTSALKDAMEEIAKLQKEKDELVEQLTEKLKRGSDGRLKDQKKRVTYAAERVTEEEFFTSSDEEESDSDCDPEWRKTPMFKRKRVIDVESEEEEETEAKPDKGCACKTGCETRRCTCRRVGSLCTALCKCGRYACSNREVPGTDVSSAIDTDKENVSMDSDEDANI